MTDAPTPKGLDPPERKPPRTPDTRRPSATKDANPVVDTTLGILGDLSSDSENGSNNDPLVGSGFFVSPDFRGVTAPRRYKGHGTHPSFRLPTPNLHPQYLGDRPRLVSWLNEIAIHTRVSGGTLALAVTMSDLFFETPWAQRYHSGFVGLICLFLASKLREQQHRQPRLDLAWHIFRERLSVNDVYQMERMVFQALGYNAHRATSFDYLVNMISIGFMTKSELATLAQNDTAGAPLERQELILLQLLLELMKESSVNAFAPDLVAASLVAFVRGELGLPPWTPALAAQTGISQEELNDCFAIVSHVLDENCAGPEAPVVYNAMTRQYLSRMDLWHLTLGGQRPDNRSVASRRSSFSAILDQEQDSIDLGDRPIRPRHSDSFHELENDPVSGDDPDDSEEDEGGPDLPNRKRAR